MADFPTLSKHFANFPIEIEEVWDTIRGKAETGHSRSAPRYTLPLRRIGWNAIIIGERNSELVLGFLRSRRGGGGTFNITNTEKVISPYDAPTLSQSAGGNLGGRTLYVAYTWGDGTNETIYSQEGSQAVDANKLLTVTPDWFPNGVTQANIYIGTVSGTLYYVSKQTTDGATWTEAETFVDLDSNAAQKNLNVDDESGFQAGDIIIINTGGAREETAEVDSTSPGVLTLVDNLTYQHTQVQADKVNHDYTAGAAAPTTNTLTETIEVTLVNEPKRTRTKFQTYSIPLIFEEVF